MEAIVIIVLAHLAPTVPLPKALAASSSSYFGVIALTASPPSLRPHPFQPMEEVVPRLPRPHRQDSPGCAKKFRRMPRPPRNAKSRQDAPRHAQPCRDMYGMERQPPWSRFRPVRSTLDVQIQSVQHSTRNHPQHTALPQPRYAK